MSAKLGEGAFKVGDRVRFFGGIGSVVRVPDADTPQHYSVKAEATGSRWAVREDKMEMAEPAPAPAEPAWTKIHTRKQRYDWKWVDIYSNGEMSPIEMVDQFLREGWFPSVIVNGRLLVLRVLSQEGRIEVK